MGSGSIPTEILKYLPKGWCLQRPLERWNNCFVMSQ
jgi:hypothetical protein